jgi:hypothetical protein
MTLRVRPRGLGVGRTRHIFKNFCFGIIQTEPILGATLAPNPGEAPSRDVTIIIFFPYTLSYRLLSGFMFK